MADKHASAGGMFIRLQNDGDKVVGAFCGEPHAREVHWIDETYQECTGEGCAHCEKSNKASLRVGINFWVEAENAMKVMEGGTMWFRDVLAVRDKYGLEKWTFEVKRVGKPKDPKTKYAILPEEKIEETTRKRITACGLHDLGSIGRGGYDADDSAGNEVVSVETAKALHEELKVLPRGDVEALFAAFRISRVRELKAADLAAVKARIVELRSALEVPKEDADSFF